MARRFIPEGQEPRQEVNRAEQIQRKQKEFVSTNETSTTMLDADGTILWHMKNVIKPKVVDNGELVDVPIIWGSSERWDSVQNQGFMRDNKGRIMIPLIMVRRTGMAPYENMKVAKMTDELYVNYQRKYSKRNRYDRFSVINGSNNPLQNEKPEYETFQVRFPDYVTVTYDLTIWCEYVEQVNRLTELLVFYGGKSWGDNKEGRASVVAHTTAYDFAQEIGTGTDRIVRTTVSLETLTPLMPKYVSDEIVSKKVNSIKKVDVAFSETAVIK
tara:strand:+ start:931 stop:1743 length:813 start_codon:yes stop_codon:yes gene_type:complete